MGKKEKMIMSFFITFFVGVTFSYMVWLLWKKLTELIGDSWVVLIICAVIVSIGLATGYFSFKKIVKKFI